MIRRSRRRTPTPTPDEALNVHVGMARARHWQRRLWLASACACAGSLLLWLAGTGLFVHLAGLVAAFGIGLALPVRSSLDWALGWVSRHGLSYPTALELSQAGNADDPYGFYAAVAKRASAQAARLEPPRLQPWWLPLLVTALVLALLPVNPFGMRGGFSGTGSPNQNQRGADPTESAAEALNPEDPAQADPPDTAANLPADTPETGAAPPTLENLSAPGGAAAEGETGAPSDAEALDRFLETLRDRPPQNEEANREQTNPFRGAAPSQRPGESGEPREAQNGEQSGEGETAQNGEGQRGEPREAQDGPGEQGEQGEGDEAGEPAEGQGDEAAQGQAGQEDGEAAAEGDAQEAQPGDAEGRAAQQAGAPGNEDGRPEAGESGEGAGDSPGSPPLGDGNRLEPSNQDPEQLQGRLNNGPSNLAGTVRLPGTQQTAAPSGGSTSAGFSRAEERAITEGRIPVEYQDIIRNYFR